MFVSQYVFHYKQFIVNDLINNFNKRLFDDALKMVYFI